MGYGSDGMMLWDETSIFTLSGIIMDVENDSECKTAHSHHPLHTPPTLIPSPPVYDHLWPTPTHPTLALWVSQRGAAKRIFRRSQTGKMLSLGKPMRRAKRMR